MTDTEYMKEALQAAWQGLEEGEMPFGACVVRNGRVLSVAHNCAKAGMDTTAHAEVQAIKEASRSIKSLELTGATMYSTCEPCPMCFTACVWAKVGRIVYACGIEDAEQAGIRQVHISSVRMNELSQSGVILEGGLLREEGRKLFGAWTKGEVRPVP